MTTPDDDERHLPAMYMRRICAQINYAVKESEWLNTLAPVAESLA